MIKNFFQKHRAVLLAIIITAVVSGLVTSGYFVIKNEKKKSDQKVEALQKSMDELQAKAESSAKNEEPQVANENPEANIQPTPTTQKSTVVAPATEEIKEKTVPCSTYANTTVQVSSAECDLIKQKNEQSKEIDKGYQNCVAACEAVYRSSVPVTSKSQYDSVFGSGAYENKVSQCQDKRDNCKDDCLDARDNQMKKLWK
jgi:mannitol-specific phosphotransferase system IIBC component